MYMFQTLTLVPGEEVASGLSKFGAVLQAINAPKILSCVVLVVVCLVVYKLVMRLVNAMLNKGTVEPTLHGFIRTGVRVLLLFVITLLVASELGFDVTSLIALLSVAGLVLLIVGIVNLVDKLRHNRYLAEGGDPNIIDADE